MNIRYHVDLSRDERDELKQLLSAGKCAARRLKRAQILLAADAGSSDDAIEATRRSTAPGGALSNAGLRRH